MAKENKKWIAWVAVIALILAVVALAVIINSSMTGNAITNFRGVIVNVETPNLSCEPVRLCVDNGDGSITYKKKILSGSTTVHDSCEDSLFTDYSCTEKGLQNYLCLTTRACGEGDNGFVVGEPGSFTDGDLGVGHTRIWVHEKNPYLAFEGTANDKGEFLPGTEAQAKLCMDYGMIRENNQIWNMPVKFYQCYEDECGSQPFDTKTITFGESGILREGLYRGCTELTSKFNVEENLMIKATYSIYGVDLVEYKKVEYNENYPDVEFDKDEPRITFICPHRVNGQCYAYKGDRIVPKLIVSYTTKNEASIPAKFEGEAKYRVCNMQKEECTAWDDLGTRVDVIKLDKGGHENIIENFKGILITNADDRLIEVSGTVRVRGTGESTTSSNWFRVFGNA